MGNAQLQQSGTDATHEVVGQKTFCPQDVLQLTTKHPQRKHIKEEMLDTAMQEHVGNKLV
jgi:hypothetical protein